MTLNVHIPDNDNNEVKGSIVARDAQNKKTHKWEEERYT